MTKTMHRRNGPYHPRVQTTPAYNSTRGGQNFNSGHILAENIRPWTGITVRNWLQIPADCICTWAINSGSIELKFRWNACVVHRA